MGTIALAINDLASQVEELTMLLPQVPASKISFATSLIGQFNTKRSRKQEPYLTPNQEPWIGKLIALAKGIAPAAPARQTHQVGDLTGLLNLFATAGKNLKYPQITLEIDGTVFVLNVAGEKSKAPGSVNIQGPKITGGNWKDRKWYGRVSPEGVYDPSRQLTPELSGKLLPLLQALATDPVAGVKAYASVSGQCMFCAKGLGPKPGQPETLTTRRSVAAGMGEECSKNYGMHDHWKQASK